MRIDFANDALKRVCTDEAHKLDLPFAVIVSARRRLIQLEAALDERDLRSLKSLNYREAQGEHDGQRSIRLEDRYRMLFALSASDPLTATILEIRHF